MTAPARPGLKRGRRAAGRLWVIRQAGESGLMDLIDQKVGWVNRRVEQLSRRNGEGQILRQVQRHLYAAQSQLPVAPEGIPRAEILRHLLRAERSLDFLEEKRDWVQGDWVDWNGARRRELLLRSKALTVLMDLNRGGRILELSDKRKAVNLIRSDAAQGAGAGWVDHAWALGMDVQTFARGEAPELGDFPQGPYRGRLERVRGGLRVELNRHAKVRVGGCAHSVFIEKSISLPARGRTLELTHRLTHRSGRGVSFLFGSELHLDVKDAHVNRLGTAGGVRRFSVLDPALKLKLDWTFRRPARLWYFPLESGGSTSGRERFYEGVSVTGVWAVSLKPRGTWSTQWRLSMGEPDGDF